MSELEIKKPQGPKKRTSEGRKHRNEYDKLRRLVVDYTQLNIEKLVELKRIFEAVNEKLPDDLKFESPYTEIEIVEFTEELKEQLKLLALKLISDIPPELMLSTIRDLDLKEPEYPLPVGLYRTQTGNVINPFTTRHLEARKAVTDTLDLISKCTPKLEILEKVSQMNNISTKEANIRYQESLREFFNSKEFTDYKFLNMARLDNIIKKTYDLSKYGDTLKAIDLLNKMVGAYAPEEHKVLQLNVVVF